MNKRIRIAPLAKNDFAGILEYLVKVWNPKVANNFIDVFEESLNRISHDAEQFTYYDRKMNIRKCVVTKHNTIYFRESISEIQVLRIYDVRQHPKKLKF